jgi:RNA polymerase sigma-70 factor, ECF subfamily
VGKYLLAGGFVVLSEVDRGLLERCLGKEPRSWEDFVDRFLGLVTHVVQHTAAARSIRLGESDREDLVAEVFLELLRSDMAVLRRFRATSSLATYLTVISRRVVVRQLLKAKTRVVSKSGTPAGNVDLPGADSQGADDPSLNRVQNRDHIEQLLRGLNGKEADVIRMFHLEGKTYDEISTKVGIPENSIGPTLTRARAKMRDLGLQS